MDKTLPNGTVVYGLPDDMSDEDFKRIAIEKGYATSDEYARDTKTAADYLSTVGELGGGLAGAYYGAAVGTAIMPVVGTAIGGLIGGATGTLLGSVAGEVTEAALEGRKLDGQAVGEQAFGAAGTDLVFSAGLGVIGKGLGMIVKPIYNLVRTTPTPTFIETAVQKAALDVKNGISTVEEAAAKYGLPPDSLSKFEQELLKNEDEILRAASLNEKLMQRGGQLLPTQIPTNTKGILSQEVAQASLVLSREIDQTLDIQNKYIQESFNEILDSTATLTREETGKAIKALAKDTETALKETVAPLYKEIDKRGNIYVSTIDVMQKANDFSKGLGRAADASVRKAKQSIAKLPMFPKPKEAAVQIARLQKDMESLRRVEGAGNAVAMLSQAIKGLEKKLTGPQFVSTASAKKDATNALNTLINKYGQTGIKGTYAQKAKDILEMRDKMSFSEAHEELSNLKSLLRDMNTDLGAKDSQAVRLMSNAVTSLEKSMQKTASKFDPSLKQLYKDTSKMYKEGVDVINGAWIVKSLNKDNAAKIGEDLVKAGEQVGVDSVRALIAKAKQLDSKNQGAGILKSMESTYLNTLFSQRTARESEQFAKKMLEKPFRDTFNAIVEPAMAKQLDNLAKEVTLLQKGLGGAESAATLSIRSREIGAATDFSIAKTAVFATLGNVVRKNLSAEAIKDNIKTVQEINARLKAGTTLPPSLIERFVANSGLVGIQAGQVTNALYNM
jgi:hypothetical protein